MYRMVSCMQYSLKINRYDKKERLFHLHFKNLLLTPLMNLFLWHIIRTTRKNTKFGESVGYRPIFKSNCSKALVEIPNRFRVIAL